MQRTISDTHDRKHDMKIQMTIGGGATITNKNGIVVHRSKSSMQLAETVAMLIEELSRRIRCHIPADPPCDARSPEIVNLGWDTYAIPGECNPQRKADNVVPGANDPKIGTGTSAAVGEAVAPSIGDILDAKMMFAEAKMMDDARKDRLAERIGWQCRNGFYAIEGGFYSRDVWHPDCSRDDCQVLLEHIAKHDLWERFQNHLRELHPVPNCCWYSAYYLMLPPSAIVEAFEKATGGEE